MRAIARVDVTAAASLRREPASLMAGRTGKLKSAATGVARNLLFFFVEIVQLFLQTTLGQHVFELAPGSFTLFCGGVFIRARGTSIDKAIELLFLFVAFCDEVIVEIEVIVVSLHHVFPKKSWRIN
jgi:hypothetical protein